MGKFSGAISANSLFSDVEDEIFEDLELAFDDADDDFMERSQRQLLKAKRGRTSRRLGDWD